MSQLEGVDMGLMRSFIFVLLACAAVWATADTKCVFTPKGGPVLQHPLAGEPAARDMAIDQAAVFEQHVQSNVEVSLRITGGVRGDRSGTGIAIWIRNLSPSEVLTVKPTVDVMDGSGHVLPIFDMGKLLEAARSGLLHQSESQSFFYAQGNQRFVANAYAGYAIGSLLSAAAKSSNDQRVAEQIRMWEKHWLKAEYRIPPGAKVDAVATLTGIPLLPITVRVTAGDKVFNFSSVASMQEAADIYSSTHGGASGPITSHGPNDSCVYTNSCR